MPFNLLQSPPSPAALPLSTPEFTPLSLLYSGPSYSITSPPTTAPVGKSNLTVQRNHNATLTWPPFGNLNSLQHPDQQSRTLCCREPTTRQGSPTPNSPTQSLCHLHSPVLALRPSSRNTEHPCPRDRCLSLQRCPPNLPTPSHVLSPLAFSCLAGGCGQL